MGVFYFEDKELPEYQNTDANKILKIDTDGVFLQWLEDTKELPVNASFTTTAFNNGSNTSNNTNMMTLNQNGPANFNTFTPSYSTILLPLTNTNINSNANYFFGGDVNESNGVFIFASGTSTPSATRLFVSGISGSANYLTSFTTINDSVLVTSQNIRIVVYGNGAWVVASSNNAEQNVWYTTVQTGLSGWTRVPNSGIWTTARPVNQGKFINGQFVLLCTGSWLRISSDGVNWSEIQITTTGYQIKSIAYSPQLRLYVIGVGSANVFLTYSGTTLPTTGSNMFTVRSVSGSESNNMDWSPKLGMFLSRNASGTYTYSKDGISWAQYTSTALGTYNYSSPIKWINDFGGFFIDVVFQSTNNCIVSRDGFNWVPMPFTYTGAGNSVVYNSTNKFIAFGQTSNTTSAVFFKNLSTLFSSYVDADNIYTTINSNTRFRDTLEYETQTITTASGNNHFTVASFNRPAINFDTTNGNANIYLQGSSFNGRIGTKFRISKTVSTNNGVRIHAYEPVRLISPLVNMLNFNIQSTPNVYNIIPQTYFGTFDLTRVNDETNGIYTGTWVVDNVDVYPLLSGTHVISDFSVGGSFYSNGLNYGRFTDYVPTAGAIHTFNYNLATHGSHVQINAINSNQTIFINLPSLNVTPYQNRTFIITFDLILDNARINTTALFAYQSPSVRLSRGKRPAQDYTGELVYEPRCWRLDTPGGGYARADLRGGPISFLVTTNSYYTWYKCISNDDEFFEDVGTVDCKLFSGNYYLDVNNSIIDRTLYKYNEIAGAPTGSNVTLNFEELTTADDKFTVYFTMGSNNATGNFNIKNNMSSTHVIRLFSGGNLITITSGNFQTEDGQALYRCTYYYNRLSNNIHVWVIYKL